MSVLLWGCLRAPDSCRSARCVAAARRAAVPDNPRSAASTHELSLLLLSCSSALSSPPPLRANRLISTDSLVLVLFSFPAVAQQEGPERENPRPLQRTRSTPHPSIPILPRASVPALPARPAGSELSPTAILRSVRARLRVSSGATGASLLLFLSAQRSLLVSDEFAAARFVRARE